MPGTVSSTKSAQIFTGWNCPLEGSLPPLWELRLKLMLRTPSWRAGSVFEGDAPTSDVARSPAAEMETKDNQNEHVTQEGAEWTEKRRHFQGQPAEGAAFPTTAEDRSSRAAASLASGGTPANYQTQTWDLHFYKMLTQEANLFP